MRRWACRGARAEEMREQASTLCGVAEAAELRAVDLPIFSTWVGTHQTGICRPGTASCFTCISAMPKLWTAVRHPQDA